MKRNIEVRTWNTIICDLEALIGTYRKWRILGMKKKWE